MRRSRPTGPAFLCVALLSLPACGDNGGWQGTVTDSAGIPIVTSTGDGIWDADEAWSVHETLTIGTAEGDPAYQFAQISGIDIGADGRIYVIDQQASEVRIFTRDGAFVSSVGRAGSGPGELSRAAGPIFVTASDTVVVPDILNQRISLYTAGGEPAGSRSLPMAGGIPVKWLEAPDGSLIQQAMVMAFPGQEDVEPRNLLIRRAPTGAVRDTVLTMPIGESVSFSGGGASVTLFESEPVWTVGPDGRLYTGINSEYSLAVRSPDGQLVRIVRKPFDQRPVTESDQAELIRILKRLWADYGMPPQMVEERAQAIRFADTYPAYANVLGGPQGTLWVQRIQTPDEIREQGGTFDIQDMGSATWEVFDAEGRLLGSVRMPPRFAPMTFTHGAFWGVLRDELEVQHVARMEVSTGDPPAEELPGE